MVRAANFAQSANKVAMMEPALDGVLGRCKQMRNELSMNFQALVLIVLLCTPLRAQRNVEPTEWSVEGVNRQALVISPSQATSEPAPGIFLVHVH